MARQAGRGHLPRRGGSAQHRGHRGVAQRGRGAEQQARVLGVVAERCDTGCHSPGDHA